jgi:hypothetical protein
VDKWDWAKDVREWLLMNARRTYNATLAELTSLEELMRTMMADNGVHPEVVTKLWQVYSTSIPLLNPASIPCDYIERC